MGVVIEEMLDSTSTTLKYTKQDGSSSQNVRAKEQVRTQSEIGDAPPALGID